MFLTIRLNGTLEMMQNDVETSEFETETWRFGYFWKMMFDINFWRRTTFSVKFICT